MHMRVGEGGNHGRTSEIDSRNPVILCGNLVAGVEDTASVLDQHFKDAVALLAGEKGRIYKCLHIKHLPEPFYHKSKAYSD